MLNPGQQQETDQLLPTAESSPNSKYKCGAAVFCILALGLTGASAFTLYKSIQEGDMAGIVLGSAGTAVSVGLASLSVFFGCKKCSIPADNDIENPLPTPRSTG
ncbi:MAG: hypothetical protein K0S08_544 [Gammaproteobacteria bacterium]|nr:hypothetical protein [Gammaproteobacteria bacterium]